LLLSILILISAVWLFHSQTSMNVGIRNNLNEVKNKLAAEIKRVDQHYQSNKDRFQNIRSLYQDHESFSYPFIVLQNERLLYWSDFHFLPSNREIRGEYYVKLIQTRDSYYLLIKYSKEPAIEVIYSVPLVEKYPIVNEYLKGRVNERIFQSENIEISLKDAIGFHLVTYKDSGLFQVKFNYNYAKLETNLYSVIWMLCAASFILFGIFLWRSTQKINKAGSFGKAALQLLFWLVLVRSLMIYFNFPFIIFSNELFNPRNYASSTINPSLGDLFLNVSCVGILATFVFKYYYKIAFFQWSLLGNSSKRTIVSVILVFLNFALLSIYFLLFNSLNFHSQWSLDISRELNFRFLKIVSYLVVVIGGYSYFLFAHIIYKTFIKVNDNHLPRVIINYCLGTLLFIAVALLDNWEYVIITLIGTVYFLVLYVFNLPRSLRRIQYLSFVYFFIGSLPLCLIGGYSIYRYQNKKLVEEKDRLVSQLLVENDVVTEFLLNEAGSQIAEDVFIQNRIFNPYVSKINIKQRVQRVYLNNQLEKYDIDIRLFNSKGRPIDDTKESLQDLRAKYNEFSMDSTMYFVNRYEENTIKRYMKIVSIKRYSRIAGYVLIDLKLRRVIPNSVYPMLLIDNRYTGPDIGSEYSYAIYEKNKLIFNTGDYHYNERIDSRILQHGKSSHGFKKDNYVHFTVDGRSNRVFIISFVSYPLQNAFSNFSFLFILFLGHILLALIALTVYLKIKGLQQNYAARIQLFLNAAFLIPLIIICVSAISVIIQSYDENLEHENMERAENISTRISESVSNYLQREISKEDLSEVVNEISQFAEIDINIFGNNGRLLASSQPLIYENELLAEVINPKAYAGLYIENEGSLVLEEQIGELSYKNTYTPIKSFESGQQIGILSLPFFEVRKELEENVISVLTSVMNIFTVIFLVFLVLSYLASTWLTFPLRLITQKIRKTTLLDTNEPLEWQSNDEIGLMVGEYNKMLLNLEESKIALAQSEKETAWREIARQVAHEIKNPLTPMQLTLQHMRRTLSEDQINKEKRIQQIDALLHQINTLSDIATSFSAFAKMPIPKNEPFELNSLINETVALYDKEELADIKVDLPPKKFVVSADKKWIGQAISNIIINGIHAAEEKENTCIKVTLKAKTGNKCQLTISDNGKGIADDIRNKIFVPNFSTKEKGSGIGLAIAKRAVEHAGGAIWFETEQEMGTTFYIELPLFL